MTTATLELYELTPSPNNVKARIALAYKGLSYERKPLAIDAFPGDRTPLVKLSRQPRAPVLKHGPTVIFDSGAILRYLEANFPGTPPLFSEDYATFGEIETWEQFAHGKLSEPIKMLFGQAFAPTPDPKVIAKANALLHEATGALEDRLSGRAFLVGDHLTAADIVCAAGLYLTDLTPEAATSNPIAGFFLQHLKLGEGREKTSAWIRKVVGYDPIMGRRG